MGFLIAELVLMLVVAAVAGFGIGYWWVRRQYLDVTDEHQSLKIDLETAQTRLAAPPLELTAHEEPKPLLDVSPEGLTHLLQKLEHSVSSVNDGQVARVKALEGQLRTLSRQLQDVLPHPVDGQDIARRLDTLGASLPQPKLNLLESRLARLETMVVGLCTQAGTEVPPAPMASRLPSSPSHSRLPPPTGGGFGSVAPSGAPPKPSSLPPRAPSSTAPKGASSVPPKSPSSPAHSSPQSSPPSSVAPKAPRPRAV